MKEAIHQKSGNKAWLQSLVDTKATDASKRILLSKLMEENHATISKELDKIRFSKSIMINTTPNPVPEQPDLAIKDKTGDAVMNDDVKIDVNSVFSKSMTISFELMVIVFNNPIRYLLILDILIVYRKQRLDTLLLKQRALHSPS